MSVSITPQVQTGSGTHSGSPLSFSLTGLAGSSNRMYYLLALTTAVWTSDPESSGWTRQYTTPTGGNGYLSVYTNPSPSGPISWDFSGSGQVVVFDVWRVDGIDTGGSLVGSVTSSESFAGFGTLTSDITVIAAAPLSTYSGATGVVSPVNLNEGSRYLWTAHKTTGVTSVSFSPDIGSPALFFNLPAAASTPDPEFPTLSNARFGNSTNSSAVTTLTSGDTYYFYFTQTVPDPLASFTTSFSDFSTSPGTVIGRAFFEVEVSPGVWQNVGVTQTVTIDFDAGEVLDDGVVVAHLPGDNGPSGSGGYVAGAVRNLRFRGTVLPVASPETATIYGSINFDSGASTTSVSGSVDIVPAYGYPTISGVRFASADGGTPVTSVPLGEPWHLHYTLTNPLALQEWAESDVDCVVTVPDVVGISKVEFEETPGTWVSVSDPEVTTFNPMTHQIKYSEADPPRDLPTGIGVRGVGIWSPGQSYNLRFSGTASSPGSTSFTVSHLFDGGNETSGTSSLLVEAPESGGSLYYLKLDWGGGKVVDLNPIQTISYLRHPELLGGTHGSVQGLSVQAECDCDALHYNGDASVRTYVNPAADMTWWYDGTNESREFLGVYITDITGLDGQLKRNPIQRIVGVGGASLGPLRGSHRELKVTGLAFSLTCRGMEYGMRALVDGMRGLGCTNCSLAEAEVWTCCPSVLSTEHDTLELETGPRWTMRDTGLIDGPHWGTPPLENRKCFMRSVEFTLGSEHQWLYKAPTVLNSSLIPAAELVTP